MILIPAYYPSVHCLDFMRLSSSRDANNRALPPPGTIPSAIAARVAHKASVTLSLISPTST